MLKLVVQDSRSMIPKELRVEMFGFCCYYAMLCSEPGSTITLSCDICRPRDCVQLMQVAGSQYQAILV